MNFSLTGQNPFIQCAVVPYVKLQFAESALPVQWTSSFSTQNPPNPPAPVAPLAPTNITVTNIQPTSFDVSWTAGAYAESYNIVWGSFHFSTKATNFSLTGLPQGTTNTLYIYSHNEDGNTPGTPQVVSTTYFPPGVPTGLIASNITYNSFTLNWSASQYAVSYTAQWFGTTPPTNGVVTGTSATFSGLPSAIQGNCIVTAINPGGTAASQPYSVSTLVAPPSAPTNVVPQNITYNSFTAHFDYTGPPCTFSATWGSFTATSITNNVATFTGLPQSTTNNVIITATNISGTTNSTPVSCTTGGLPAKPTGLATTRRGTSYFNCSWTNVPGNTYTATFGTYNGQVSGNTATFSGIIVGASANLVVTATNQYGSTASDPFPVTLLTPQTVNFFGGAGSPPYPSGPGVFTLTTFTIPSDFDIQNNNTSSPNFISPVGSLIGYDPNQPSGTNFSYYMYKAPATATNSYGFLTVQGQNLNNNTTGWNTQNPWVLNPGDVWTYDLSIGAGNGCLDTTNILFNYTYNPFSIP